MFAAAAVAGWACVCVCVNNYLIVWYIRPTTERNWFYRILCTIYSRWRLFQLLLYGNQLTPHARTNRSLYPSRNQTKPKSQKRTQPHAPVCISGHDEVPHKQQQSWTYRITNSSERGESPTTECRMLYKRVDVLALRNYYFVPKPGRGVFVLPPRGFFYTHIRGASLIFTHDQNTEVKQGDDEVLTHTTTIFDINDYQQQQTQRKPHNPQQSIGCFPSHC